MKTKHLLGFYLTVMAVLLVWGLCFPQTFLALMEQPDFYLHAKFFHILSVTLFFANVVIGTVWETRSLLSKKTEIIRYTYKTVTWLDAVFTAPLILVSVLSGIMLGTILGGVWNIGWLSVAFSLFLFSGAVWLVADIPTQYQVNKLFASVAPGEQTLPPRLMKLLWFRLGINCFSVIPLLIIFVLMIHKPEVPKVASWFTYG